MAKSLVCTTRPILFTLQISPIPTRRQSPDRGRRSSSALRQRPVSATRSRPDAGGGGGGGGGAGTYVPIHQRVADLLRSRNEKLAKAQMRMVRPFVKVVLALSTPSGGTRLAVQ